MYLRRKIDTFLREWKSDSKHKPLIVKGARQIGKTESIKRFAAENYENVVTINFALEKEYLGICEKGYTVDSILKSISVIDPTKRFTAGNTLIFFDELQDLPDIATSLKSFREDGRYDVICSGSLLGIHYKKIHSNSVGSKTEYTMRSMDFEEFLWAMGYGDGQIGDIFEHMRGFTPFGKTELGVYDSLFMDFTLLGGMPAVVLQYVEEKNFSGSLELQRELILDYDEDIRKYAEGLDPTKILSVFRSIPAQLAKENKKFQFNKVAPSARSKDYLGCIEWLKDSGIINACYNLEFPELPLKGNYDEGKFKLYMGDTGLLVAMLDSGAQSDLRVNKNLGVYKGALYENMAAEALVKQGLDLYYHKRENSTLEEDFFLRTADELLPLEVKSNSNGSKSLRTLIQSEKYSDIRRGLKFGKFNIGAENSIYTFPLFCLFLVGRLCEEL